MPQLSYSLSSDAAKYAGQSADNSIEEVLTGQPLPAQSELVTITVANTTAYTLHTLTGAAGTAVDATYTSDGSATKAEIVAGLLAAFNALVEADCSAINYGGDLVLVAKPGVEFPRWPTSTGAGTLALASNTVTIPFGAAVALDTGRASSTDQNTIPIRLPNSASDILLGLAKHSQFFESTYYPASAVTKPSSPVGQAVNVAKRGHFWVKVEEDVNAGDQAYVRFTADSLGQGAFRKSLDGTAQVTTMTPTAVNSTEYQLNVDGHFYGYTSDSSATATEICDGLRTAIAADANATVTATGTATLILTAKTAGVAFSAQGDANMAFATGTANVAKAVAFSGARYLSQGSANGFAVVQLGA